MSNIARLKSNVTKYKKAKTNIDLTIEKLEEAKVILENKNYFSVSYIDTIVDDIINSIANLKSTKVKIDNRITSIEKEIKTLEEAEASSNAVQAQ